MSKISLLILIPCALLLAAFSPSSQALGWFGHQTVCQLAFDALPKQKQEIIESLLATMSSEQQNLLNKYSRKKRGSKVSFAQSCTWADVMKNQPGYKQFKAWHYINVDRSTTKIDASSCSKNCITKAIDIHKKQLVEAKNSWDRAQALMFLSHWLGDIHQPLHVSFASDLGGNKIKIKKLPSQRCNNLHWLWDDCLIKQHYKQPQELVAKLSKMWASSPILVWQNSDQFTWANESLAMLRKPAFGYCQLNDNNVCLAPATLPVELSEDYFPRYAPQLENRTLQAAVRLHKLLEDTL